MTTKPRTKRLLKPLCEAYALLTLAYPSAFRERFGREMRLAFESEAVATAATAGDRGLWALALRTAGDWIVSLSKEYAAMRRFPLAACLVLTLLAVDWLAFHDWREPHSVRDYLTLTASLLAFAYLGLDLWRDRTEPAGRAS